MTKLSLSAAALTLLGATACGSIDPQPSVDENLETELQTEPPIANCTAMPVCNDGETTSSTPVEGAREVSLCGQTIYCSEAIANCLAMPVCNDGETTSSTPVEGARAVSLCGQTIYCSEAIANCTAMPTCGEDEMQVDESYPNAEAVSMCGQTVFCAPFDPDYCPGCGLG